MRILPTVFFVGTLLLTTALAQSEQIVRPSSEIPWQKDVPALEYIGENNLRLQNWGFQTIYPLDGVVSWGFTSAWSNPATAIRFETLDQSKSITLKTLRGAATPEERAFSACQYGTFGRSDAVFIDAKQLGISKPSAVTYRVTPLGEQGQVGESILMSFNFANGYAAYPTPNQTGILQLFLPSASYTLLGRVNNRIQMYVAGNKPIRGIRFKSTQNAKTIFFQIPANQQFNQGDRQFITSEFNASDFGLTDGVSAVYDTTIIGADGQESQPWQISFNARLSNKFRQSIHDLRAEEALTSVFPIQFYQPIGSGALAIYSLENFSSFTRVRANLRSQFGAATDRDLLIQSISNGFMQISDDSGKKYNLELEQTRDGQCGFRRMYNSLDFGLVITPSISDSVKTMILTYKAPSEFANRLAEPFRSGFQLPLPIVRR
ncbi:MAG: hypothetical protein RLZZ156_1845 [Deinococcota bacterium]